MNLLHYEATLALAWHLLIYNRISDINAASLHEVLYKKHICISKSQFFMLSNLVLMDSSISFLSFVSKDSSTSTKLFDRLSEMVK